MDYPDFKILEAFFKRGHRYRVLKPFRIWRTDDPYNPKDEYVKVGDVYSCLRLASEYGGPEAGLQWFLRAVEADVSFMSVIPEPDCVLDKPERFFEEIGTFDLDAGQKAYLDRIKQQKRNG